jgi:hypothetical protein
MSKGAPFLSFWVMAWNLSPYIALLSYVNKKSDATLAQ